MIEIVIAAVSGIGAAVMTAIGARRVSSGRVTTSEAAQLWAEAKEQRDWLAQQLDVLREEHAECQEMLARHEQTIRMLEVKVAQLERRP